MQVNDGLGVALALSVDPLERRSVGVFLYGISVTLWLSVGAGLYVFNLQSFILWFDSNRFYLHKISVMSTADLTVRHILCIKCGC